MSQDSAEGHRHRLRSRFVQSPADASAEDLAELLLTYAIPRKDVKPIAREILQTFGNLPGVLEATFEELTRIAGVGPQAAILLKVVGEISRRGKDSELSSENNDDGKKEKPFEVLHTPVPLFDLSDSVKPEMNAYVNDEIENSLRFIPHAINFEHFEEYKAYLAKNLPYNSASTRNRRANYIVSRFFPYEQLNTPLAYYASRCAKLEDLKPVLFYHLLKAEPLALKIAEELIWPALPQGRVDREQLRESILRYLPDLGASSQKNAIRSILTTYDLLSIGTRDGDTLYFQSQTGTLQAFIYVISAEYPTAGIFAFDGLLSGPMRRWLLWDRNWILEQLYALQDWNIVAKVSEIDSVRQFTLRYDQETTLKTFFAESQK